MSYTPLIPRKPDPVARFMTLRRLRAGLCVQYPISESAPSPPATAKHQTRNFFRMGDKTTPQHELFSSSHDRVSVRSSIYSQVSKVFSIAYSTMLDLT